MQIDYRSQNIDPACVLKGCIERRLRFALDRFGDRVGQVIVRMSGNTNENECRISTELRPFGRVTVREIDPDLLVAVDRATGRVGRLFGRELQRVRDVRRSQQSARIAA